MPRPYPISLFLAFLVVVLPVPSLAAPETAWREIHSTHFTVITDAGERKGREVALRFEQMRAVFNGLLSKERLQESIPLTILALSNDKSYFQAAPLYKGQPIDVPGFFLTGEDQDFITLNLAEEEPWRAVAHDFSLMLLKYNYPPAQAWFDEGLAQYFSSIHVDDRQAQIGGEPALLPAVRDELLENHDPHAPRSLTEVLNSQEWMPLPALFATKPDALSSGHGAPRALFYAESWAVMRYLLHENKLPETGTYLDSVLNHNLSVEDAVQKAYGVSAAQLEQAAKDYFHSTAAAGADAAQPKADAGVSRFPVPVGPDDSAIPSKPFPEADARALYAGVQVRIPERRDAGLKTLQQLATTPTEVDKKAETKQSKRVGEDAEQLPNDAIGNALAHRILAWDHIEHGEYEESFTEIGQAAALNQRDMWVRYYLSVAKYRMARAKKTDVLGLANMLLDLKGVLEWNPEMASAYDLLAVGRNAGGTTSAAMQSERAAILLSPRDERYKLHLAEIYISSKKWEAADALLEKLQSSSDTALATQARELLATSGTQRKYGIPGNSTDVKQAELAPQKSPFDVLEQDAAKRASTENAPSGPDKRETRFVKGRLMAVDCSKAPAAILMVNSGNGVFKLRATDYRAILLIGADDFSCEWRDRQVTANYKAREGTEGDLVSLEMR